jgi:1,4-dihydroxy-2-naphthoyl-CoA hydrolase
VNRRITAEAIASFQAGSFPADLGIEPLEIDDGVARGRMLVGRRHLHPFGYLHGGAWVALADTVAAWGTMRHLPPETPFTTIDLKINVFAAGREGDELIATASPLHTGRRTHVWQVQIRRGDRLVAQFTCTQMVLSRARR